MEERRQENLEETFLLDQELRELGIYHGFPLQAENFNIVGAPGSEMMREVSKIREEKRRSENKQEGGSEKKRKYYLLRNEWKLRRPWHGVYGIVQFVADWEDRENPHSTTYVFIEKQWPPALRRLCMFLETMHVRCNASLVEAEERALQKLRTLIDDTQWRCYRLADAFQEQGKSGVYYVLRKNRPTLALRGKEGRYVMPPLAALCLHPLGYYRGVSNDGTYAGVMAPTDEVIAHLLMIRADEHYFWRKAIHHYPDEPESGI